MRRMIHWKGSGSLIGKMRKLYFWKRKMVNCSRFLFSSLILFFSHHIGRRDWDGGSFLWMFLCYFHFLVSHSKWLSRLSISYVKTFLLPTYDRFITRRHGLCSRVENARTAIVPANETRTTFADCNDGCRIGMLSGGVKAQRSRSTRAAIRRICFHKFGDNLLRPFRGRD